jgi:hypothetical protein
VFYGSHSKKISFVVFLLYELFLVSRPGSSLLHKLPQSIVLFSAMVPNYKWIPHLLLFIYTLMNPATNVIANREQSTILPRVSHIKAQREGDQPEAHPQTQRTKKTHFELQLYFVLQNVFFDVCGLDPVKTWPSV